MSTFIKKKVKSFDGTRISYKLFEKDSKKAIILCNGFVCVDSYWKYFVQCFSPNHKVITWDYRGHGETDHPADLLEISILSHARDLLAVLDHAHISRAVVGGFSMGVQVALEFYHQWPERTAALLLVGGSYENPIASLYNTRLFELVFKIIYWTGLKRAYRMQGLWKKLLLSRIMYPGAIMVKAISRAASQEDMNPYFVHLSTFDLEFFLRMSKEMCEHSAAQFLSQIKVPTLIVIGTKDMVTPIKIMEKIHRDIPGADILRVPLGTHVVLIEQPDLINLRCEEFFKEKVFPEKANKGEKGQGKDNCF